MIGTTSNRQGVMIKPAGLTRSAIGAGNGSADIWDFLSRYCSDMITGKLLVAR
jgi:hypothetical protein